MALGPQHATSGSRAERLILVGALILLCLEAYENAKFPVPCYFCTFPHSQRLTEHAMRDVTGSQPGQVQILIDEKTLALMS